MRDTNLNMSGEATTVDPCGENREDGQNILVSEESEFQCSALSGTKGDRLGFKPPRSPLCSNDLPKVCSGTCEEGSLTACALRQQQRGRSTASLRQPLELEERRWLTGS